MTSAHTYGPNELDPAHPWAYRGDPGLLANGNLDTLRRDWDVKHPGAQLSPLFAQVYEPSQQTEIVFVSHAADDRWGIATTSEGGIDFLVDEPLPSPSTVLMTTLSGDEVPRLLVVAGPATGDLSYAKDGATWRTIPGPTAGIAFVPLEGDTSHDAVRVLDGNGDLDHPVFLGPAPDASPTHTVPPSEAKPVNYLDWVSRGSDEAMGAPVNTRATFAKAMGRPGDTENVEYHSLWGGTDGNIRYTIGQAWFRGDTQARTFGWALGTDNGNEVFLGPVTPKGTQVIAYLVSRPSKGTDLLVVIPRIGAGTVSYSPDGSSPYTEKANTRSDLTPVALIDRNPTATRDRIKVLDGDGMKVLYDGAVQPLLCGQSGCG